LTGGFAQPEGEPLADNRQGYLGYIQYVGPSVESGFLGAKKSAQALLGIDEALRYFVSAQSAQLAGVEYEIPVRVQRGSWQALIPETLPEWVRTALGLAASAYLVKAAQKMAENDFDDVGLRSIFKNAIEAIQWAIRIGKHLGTLTKRTFENVRWRAGNTEIGIANDAGEVLYVPKEYLELFERMPRGLLVKITSVVTEERILEVVVNRDGVETSESVSFEHRPVFCPDDSAALFPQLKHGDVFDEEGLVTRGNENANSLGFLYEGHILTCYPKEGSIVRFKSALFVRSRMQGEVTRGDEFGEPTEPRPKIIFTHVTPLEMDELPDGSQPRLLFDDEV
jgi:hypothetical protein